MLYFLFLRRPQSLNDMRSDPFWEFGSFGVTGCHRKNLLHPIRTPLREGDRLVFLQGGKQEIRVIGLTPPIKVLGDTERINLRWDQTYQPVPYAAAPILINNQGYTDFPAVLELLANTQRSTYCGKAGSRLRSRTSPIESELADQILVWFERPNLPRIAHYLEAVNVKESAWFHRGLHAGWMDFDRRAQCFAELSGVLPAPPNINSTPTTQGRRSRC